MWMFFGFDIHSNNSPQKNLFHLSQLLRNDPDPYASNPSLFRATKNPYTACISWVLNPTVPQIEINRGLFLASIYFCC